MSWKQGVLRNMFFAIYSPRQPDETGMTYTIQYHCENMEKYNQYNDEFSLKLQDEHNDLYRGKFVAFRSLMEVVD